MLAMLMGVALSVGYAQAPIQNLSEMPLQAIRRDLGSQPCGDVQLKVPPNGGRIENGQQKFLARLYRKGKSGKNGFSAGWDRILLSMLVGPATPTGYLSGRTSNVYGTHRDSIEFGNFNAIRLLNLDPAGERNIKRRVLSRDEGLMGGDSGIRTLSRFDRRALSMSSSPYRRPDSCEPHEYSDGAHVKEPTSVARRISGSVGAHPDWVRGAILLLGFMSAMTGFSFYSAWAVDRSHDLGWSSQRDTVAFIIGLWGFFGLIGAAAWLAFGA